MSSTNTLIVFTWKIQPAFQTVVLIVSDKRENGFRITRVDMRIET